MKRKVTSRAKKESKKAVKPKTELSLLDLAKLEKNMRAGERNRPDGKKHTKEAFKLWLMLPDQFKGTPERITALLGITDSISLELLRLSTMQQFAEEFGVIPQTLSRWRGEVESSADFLPDVKRQMRKLTRNVMGALYRKMMEEADAPRVMAWMKIVEDWREQLGIEHSGEIGETLSDDERKALDELIKKNTTP